jgi:hypothetical protein
LKSRQVVCKSTAEKGKYEHRGKLHGIKMAHGDEKEIDDDEFIKIFKDSDDENKFEGFGPENIIPDYEILREIDLLVI